MKLLKLLLCLMVLNVGLQSQGQVRPLSYSSASEVLSAQYWELEDIRVQLKHYEKLKNSGWIGIVISAAAVAGGAFLKIGSAMKNSYVVHGNGLAGATAKIPFATRGTLLVLGGSAGVLTSSAVVYLQKNQIAELRLKIESLQMRLRGAIAEIEGDSK